MAANRKVSIIIPCFNHGEFLHQAVDSALAQTHQDTEIIVVDDGSTGVDTRRILESFGRPRTTVLLNKHQGVSAARNAGIRAAVGDYILPLDADDWIEPDYAELASNVLDSNPEVGIVYCQADLVYGNDRQHWAIPQYSFPDFLLGNCIFNCALFRKADWERVGGFNESMLDAWEDYDFWLSLIERGAKAHQIQKVLFHYRQVEGSRNTRAAGRSEVDLLKQVAENHRELYVRNLPFLLERLTTQKRELQSVREWLAVPENSSQELVTDDIRAMLKLLVKHPRIVRAMRKAFQLRRFFRK